MPRPHHFPTLRAATRNLLLMASLLALANSSPAASGWLDKLEGAIGQRDSADETLSTGEIGSGLKEALKVGTEYVVAQLGRAGGFNDDPAVRIPLPGQLEQVRSVLARVGMDGALTDLETRLNQAAEIATPKAKTLFMDAISELTLEDARAIYNGPEDAATQYFKDKMSAPLADEMRPVVDASLADAGAVQTFDRIMERYRAVPMAPEVDANLSDYVVSKANDGIFFYLAEEEAAIRADPAKRTTDLLKRVFGG